MTLFDTIDELQAFIAVSSNFSLKSAGPAFRDAVDLHIISAFGSQLYFKLEANAGLNTEEKTLRKLLQKALAKLGLLGHLPYMLHISESGLQRLESEDYKSSYKYQEDKLKYKLALDGFNALERALIYAEEKETILTEWSNLYKYRNRRLFINTAATFNEIYRLKEGRWLFDRLASVLFNVEDLHIKKSIGEGFYAELKDQIKTKTLTAANKNAVELLQPAAAHFCVAEALKQNWISITPDGVGFTENSGNDSSKQFKTADPNQLSLSIRQAEGYANKYLEYAIKVFKGNTLYPIYNDTINTNTTSTGGTHGPAWDNDGGIFYA